MHGPHFRLTSPSAKLKDFSRSAESFSQKTREFGSKNTQVSKARTTSTMKEPLCFCEYINVRGERSHMIATCCDCEAVDAGCDRFCRCQNIPDDNYESILLLIQDRVRLPWCSGYGAKQFDWQILGPIICVLVMLLLGSLHPIMTVFSIGALAFCIFKHLRVWTRKNVKPKTKVFYVFGVFSAWIMFATFVVVIVPLGRVNIWQFLSFLMLYFLMMVSLVHARKDPGFLRTPHSGQNITAQSQRLVTNADCESSKETFKSDKNKDAVMKEDTVDDKTYNESAKLLKEGSQSIPLDQVTWLDSRPIKGDVLSLWCEICQMTIPARGAHCPVCDSCVQIRDHHCVWIDQCIGAKNHRSFILLMYFWVLTGFYGSHLALGALCDTSSSISVFWFQIPTECPGVYGKYETAFALTGVCYCVLCSLMISAVLFNQLILVVQNLTSQELHNALKLGWVRLFCWAKRNRYNKGVLANVVLFFSNRRLQLTNQQSDSLVI